MIQVRKAVSEDTESIVEFQLRMALETENLELDRDTVNKGVRAVFGDKSKGEYYVTGDDSKIIASLLITYEWSDWRNCNVWWFQSVYVIPEYRRRGIFRKMYEYIKQLSEDNDIGGLRLYVETKNHRAQSTYEALGMSSGHYSFYEWMRK